MASVPKTLAGVGEISSPFIASPSFQNRSFSRSIARKIRSSTIFPPPFQTTSNINEKICVICISDTHNTRPSLPNGDILLHAGDLSQYGIFDEIQAQLHWLNAQPHKYKIVIAGNHDVILDDTFVKLHPDRELDKPGNSRGDLKWGHINYLQNSSVEVNCKGRTLNIYGSPMTPKCGNFGFQYDPNADVWADTVPDGTDILITHGPPAVHLDEGKGCAHLLKEIWRIRPRLLVFGHIHNGRGEELITFDYAQECYENVLLEIRPWINVLVLMMHAIRQILSRTPASRNTTPSTHLVNAAIVTGRGNLAILQQESIGLPASALWSHWRGTFAGSLLEVGVYREHRAIYSRLLGRYA